MILPIASYKSDYACSLFVVSFKKLSIASNAFLEACKAADANPLNISLQLSWVYP